jgi:hypothetical protein
MVATQFPSTFNYHNLIMGKGINIEFLQKNFYT